MNEIQTFNFKNSGVRTFVDENGNPWFCAKDVCDILGYKNSRDAVSRHTKSEGVVKRDLVKTLSNGRQQGFETTFIDERNVYRLVLRSEIPDAEPFQDWVCGEVLPTIRKTGSYGTPQTPALPDFTNPAIAARAWAEQYEKNQALQAQILLEAPKVQAAEDFLKSDGDHIIRKVAKALGVGVRFLYDWLRQKKIITKFNEPYAEFVTRGYLRPCPSYHEGHDGTRKCDLTTHITNEGIFYIWNRLKKEGHIPEGRQLQLEFLKEAA